MFNLYKRIEDLCDTRGITVAQMSRDIGIHRNVMPRLKSDPSKKLSYDTLSKLSDYFNIPLDYFRDLGEINSSDIPPEPPVSKHQILFALFGDVADEITDAEYAEVQRYCDMVRLRKLEEKRRKADESN